MTVAWPDSFPAPQISGYSLQPEESIARTSMDSGVARQRRRFTSSPTKVKLRWKMSQELFGFFQSWYIYKAKAGAEWITIDLSNGQGYNPSQARFTTPYSAKPLSHDQWEVMADFEVREMAILDELQLDLTLVPGSAAEWVRLSGTLHTFVHTDLPADNW